MDDPPVQVSVGYLEIVVFKLSSTLRLSVSIRHLELVSSTTFANPTMRSLSDTWNSYLPPRLLKPT